MGSFWIVERTRNRRFPYRISIEQDGITRLALRVQDRWPGPGGQVFCLRERELDPAEAFEPLERVPIISLTRRGRKLSVAIDRSRRRRCEFLFLRKSYRHKEGEYEEIFFRTQQALRQHRARGRPSLYPSGNLEIVVDSAERYAWRFPRSQVQRSELPVGDYGLLHQGALVAVVERKTFPNLLSDIGSVQILHQQLAELSGYGHAAVVVEAQYADFLNGQRTRPWSSSYLSRMLGELTVCHPGLPIVYAGNRKLANQWAHQFFQSVAAKLDESEARVAEKVQRWHTPSEVDGGIDFEVRRAILERFPEEFAFSVLRSAFPELEDRRLRRILQGLRREGRLEVRGRGRAARWVKVSRS